LLPSIAGYRQSRASIELLTKSQLNKHCAFMFLLF